MHAGRVLTHQHLLQRVWGKTEPGTPRTIRTHLMRLRRKLGEDADDPQYIFAEPRVGYRMERLIGWKWDRKRGERTCLAAWRRPDLVGG